MSSHAGSGAANGQATPPAWLQGLPTIELFGVRFSEVTLARLATFLEAAILVRPPDGVIVSFVSPPVFKALKERPSYLDRIDVILSDGILMTRALRMLRGRDVDRISFDSTSIAPVVFRSATTNGLKTVLIGGREGVAQRAATCLQLHFPGIQISAAMDGYMAWEAAIRRIISLDPHIVICGMGAPMQELFLTELVSAGWKGFGFTCGGYLDQLNVRYDYYPAWIDHHNLRWLYRLMKEPKRMVRRYFLDYQPFFRALSREMLASFGPRLLVENPRRKRGEGR
jgi:exopolysaccharide biosynthesis WecB/TagA/CpsF family protein